MNRPTSRATLLLALPALGALGAGGLLARCGNDGGDGGADARVDAVAPSDARPLDAAPLDAGVVCNEASQGTRWTGWSRVTEADPCCTIEVPDQVDASVEPLTWMPCTNGAGGCQEMPIDWGVQPNWTRFNLAYVTAPYGTPTYVVVGRRLDVNTGEEDVYEFTTGTPVAAWRAYMSTDTVWVVNAPPADKNTWVYIGGSRDVNIVGTDRIAFAPTTGALHPSPFHDIVPAQAGNGNGVQDFASSDSTLAFDIEPAGRIGRVSASAPSTFVFSDGGSGLIFPLVHGDDVFAQSSYGNGGWAEEYRIDPDGTAVVLRAKAQTEVSNFVSDGANWYWTEAYGSSSPGLVQPTTEVWTAPYTNDATVLASTAKKIALANGAAAYDNNAVAFQGYVAIITAPFQTTVVRASDGAAATLASTADRRFAELVYVSSSEVWALMVDVGAKAPGAEHLERLDLPAWP